MSLTHVAALRNTLANAILTAIGVGSADTEGDLVFMTSGDVEVATLPLSATAGVVAGAVLTYNAITDDTNAVGGTIALFKIVDRDNNEVYRGTVTVTSGGGDIELSSLLIAAADTVSVSSLTYTSSV